MFFFSSRRRHTRLQGDWSSDVCSSDLSAMCGYQVTTVKSDARGNVDLEALRSALGPDVAGVMLTNPNKIGRASSREGVRTLELVPRHKRTSRRRRGIDRGGRSGKR